MANVFSCQTKCLIQAHSNLSTLAEDFVLTEAEKEIKTVKFLVTRSLRYWSGPHRCVCHIWLERKSFYQLHLCLLKTAIPVSPKV